MVGRNVIIVATDIENGGIVSILVVVLVVSGTNGDSGDDKLLLLSLLVICYFLSCLRLLVYFLYSMKKENLHISIYLGITYIDLDNNFVYSFGNIESPKFIFSSFSNYDYLYHFLSFCFSKTVCFLLFPSFCFSKTVCFLPT